MTPRRLLIRADASPSIGAGHVMRCLALAQAWQCNGGDSLFVCSEIPSLIEERLREEGFHCERLEASPGTKADAEMTTGIGIDWAATHAVVDGYPLGLLGASLRQVTQIILGIDDHGLTGHQGVSRILDQNLGASSHHYPGVHSLLGTRYSLIRREFQSIQSARTPDKHITDLLIILGAGDPENQSLSIIQSLESLETTLTGTVIVGPANPNGPLIAAFTKQSRHHWSVCINPQNIPELMAETGLAISAAGSTSWELSMLGIPAILIAVADNQRLVAQNLAEAGAAIDGTGLSGSKLCALVRELFSDPHMRHRMSAIGMKLVDGHGPSRVVEHLTGSYLEVRLATSQDCRWYWQLVNEDHVRSSAINTEPISWEGHTSWFNNHLIDRGTTMLIGIDANGNRVGQIRFGQMGSVLEVDFSIVTSERGKGIAQHLLERGMRFCLKRDPQTTFFARVRRENLPSARAFLRAGFVETGSEVVDGIALLLFRKGYNQ